MEQKTSKLDKLDIVQVPQLPSAMEIATLAALIAKNEGICREYDDVEKWEVFQEELTPTTRLLRKAVHLHYQASQELKECRELGKLDFAQRYRLVALWRQAFDETETPKLERKAWRFYPEQATDELREYLVSEEIVDEGGFKSSWGLPKALKKWAVDSQYMDDEASADSWWEWRLRRDDDGRTYYAVYRFEIDAFVAWRKMDERAQAAERQRNSRGETPAELMPVDSATRWMAMAAAQQKPVK